MFLATVEGKFTVDKKGRGRDHQGESSVAMTRLRWATQRDGNKKGKGRDGNQVK